MKEMSLELAKNKGIRTTISYICGLDSLKELEEGFSYLKESLTHFPIINVYQIQTNDQAKILDKEAKELTYYLKSREIIEKIFVETNCRPKRWSNYRSLWYKYFGEEQLPNNSYGQQEK